MRILSDFEVSRNPINSLNFSLSAPLFSPLSIRVIAHSLTINPKLFLIMLANIEINRY